MKFTVEWNNELYDHEWSDETNFEELENVTQVYGFVFDEENKLCVIKCKGHDNWALPGGEPENYDKSFNDVLIREVDEEADLDIKDIQRIGYLKVWKRGFPEKIFHQLRYISRVNKIREQTKDPAYNSINEREFINLEDFNKYVNWGESGEFQLNKAIKELKK